MASCERCWTDAYGDYERYRELIAERSGENTCTPEQQAGEFATKCPKCRRKTVHQHAHICMTCRTKGRSGV